MRAFLSSFGDFQLAIPMDSVLSLALQEKNSSINSSINTNNNTNNTNNKNTNMNTLNMNTMNPVMDDQNIYISLPRLFNLPEENIQHNLTLKDPNAEDDRLSANKIILIIPKVECESEIPDEKIFPIPKTLQNTGFSSYFSGIQFNSNPAVSATPILVLNSEQLIKRTQKELV